MLVQAIQPLPCLQFNLLACVILEAQCGWLYMHEGKDSAHNIMKTVYSLQLVSPLHGTSVLGMTLLDRSLYTYSKVLDRAMYILHVVWKCQNRQSVKHVRSCTVQISKALHTRILQSFKQQSCECSFCPIFAITKSYIV